MQSDVDFVSADTDSNSVVTARRGEEIKVTAAAVRCWLAVSQYVQCCCNVHDISQEPRASQGYLLTEMLFLCSSCTFSALTLLVGW